ncbi:MAG: VWA domain-containing protein [Gemmataceae bacterium]|nr:VWA domain-containing protein [Gemmataceae bacterium]
MPSFTQPWYLLLLLLVPLVVRRWMQLSRPALRYPDTALLATLPSGRSKWAHWAGIGMRAGALAALVIALAGPRLPDDRRRIPTEGIAIELVVDVSGSMAETDFEWQGERIARLEAVKRAFRLFVSGGEGPDGQRLEGRPDDLIGMQAFAARPEGSCPLTLSHSVLLRLLDREKPRSIPGECETNISDALVVSLERLRGAPSKRRVLVLLSDGEHNVPDPRSGMTPRQAAQLGANLHIPAYTIDAGGETTSSSLEPASKDAAVNREAGIKTLQEVAKITGGHYFQARDTRSLLDVCRKIDRMERERILSFQRHRHFELFSWTALLSFVLLVGVAGMEMTYWQRLP